MLKKKNRLLETEDDTSTTVSSDILLDVLMNDIVDI